MLQDEVESEEEPEDAGGIEASEDEYDPEQDSSAEEDASDYDSD